MSTTHIQSEVTKHKTHYYFWATLYIIIYRPRLLADNIAVTHI